MNRSDRLRRWIGRALAGEEIVSRPAEGWGWTLFLCLVIGAFLVKFALAVISGEAPYPGAE